MTSKTRSIILMADIAGSSGTSRPTRLMKAFRQLVDDVNQGQAGQLHSPLTITLGDEFQGVVRDREAAVRMIVGMEESIVALGRPFTLRYVMHEGRIDTPINPERAHGMMGPGLTTARTLLGELKKDRHSRFRVALHSERTSGLLNDAFLLYGALVDAWSDRDLPLLAAFMELEDYREVAAALGKDISLMWRRRRNLRMEEYNAIKRLLFSLAQLKAA
jgi:hypothetical protein